MSTTMLSEWTGHGLANGEHLDYAKAVVGALCDLDHTKVPVGEPLAALDTLNEKYTDFVNESRKFVDTEDIAKADARRDALFMALYSAIDHLAALESETSTSFGRKARVVQAVLGAYKGITRHSITKETEELRGLAFDLQKNQAAVEAITALGMLPWLNALAAANDEVDQLYWHRTTERGDRAAATGGEKTADVRKEASNLIVEVIARVNAAQRLMPSAEVDKAVAALTGVIEQYKLVAASHGSKKKSPEPTPEAAS